MKTTKISSILLVLVIYSQLSFAQNITADTTLANKYFDKGIELHRNRSFDSARVYYVKAAFLYDRHGQWQKYLNSRIKEGACFQLAWKLDSAILILKPAIEKTLMHYNRNNVIVAEAYNELGLYFYYKNEQDRAIEYYEKVLQIRKEIFGEKHTEVAGSYNNIGVSNFIKGEYDLALEYYNKALQIRKETFGEKHSSVASSYNNIGTAYSVKGDYDLALEYYNRTLQIRKELFGEEHTSVAALYDNIGIIYTNKAEYDLALEFYYQSLEIKIKQLGENNINVALAYNNLGIAYKGKSEYDLALEYYFKALKKFNWILGEKHLRVSSVYGNIGTAYSLKRHHDLALEYYLKELEIKKEILGMSHPDIALSYHNIGLVYREKADYDLAFEYITKALKIFQGSFGEKHSYVASSYNNIGQIFVNKGDYNLALKYYQKALYANLREFSDSINVFSVPYIFHYLDWDILLQSLQTKAEIFAKYHEDQTGYEIYSCLKHALLHYQACDTLINQVRQSITTKSDKLALGEQASEVYKGAVNVCINLSASCKSRQIGTNSDSVLYYNELAFYFSEKNKSSVLLEALAGAEAQKFSGIPDTLLNNEHKLQIDIALYKKILAEQPDSAKEISFRDKLFKANRLYDELITVFEGQYPEYFELKYNRKPASVNEIQKILDNKTAIISYFTGDSIITIFTITKKNMDVKTVPAIKNLADTIHDFRYGLLYTNSSKFAKTYKKYAYKMYRQLIPENVYKKIKNLIIIPDVELSMIPFETLLTENPEDKEWKELPYLIKKYNISYSYSANLFYKTFPKEATTKIGYTYLNDWLAFAPVFDDSNTAGLTIRTRELLQQLDTELDDSTGTRGILDRGGYVSPLPGTESEVRAIFEQFDNKGKKALVQIRKNANEKFIKSAELKKYRILHFATHGFVNTWKPELSGIFLAQDTTINEDGVLYSGEIYNLKLNADLTVLSACETGLGKIKKGEGLIGLTRALLYAGSKNIIVSLWKVADKSTSDLMIDFYKNLLEAKQEKQEFSQALQQAKLKMIDEGKYAHPFYWSPFILIGK